MKLNSQQQEALEDAKKWYQQQSDKGDQLVFRIFGYAGTGKTTIAKEFAKMVDGTVYFATFTGKAAHVLREKGCMGAMTIHSLIYIPKSKSAQRLRDLQLDYIKQEGKGATPNDLLPIGDKIRAEQENMKRPAFAINPDSALSNAKLLIVDEVSMVNETMGIDLETFGVPILVLGDTAQLPPVKGGGYFTNTKPDIMLTEIHRQAAGSPILKAATDVREGRGLEDSGDLIVPKGRLTIADLAEYEQVLVGTHKSRHAINTKMREHFDFPPGLPVTGDRIICTRNDSETGLLNGSQWMVHTVYEDPDDGRLGLTIKSVDGKECMSVEAHRYPFLGEETPYFEMREAQCFEYAYAMTVHKAQGSQFDRVVLVDESYKFPSYQRRAWLYTGITRAAKELVIIR